jgi:GNAT superfamily N-acetyltransferase
MMTNMTLKIRPSFLFEWEMSNNRIVEQSDDDFRERLWSQDSDSMVEIARTISPAVRRGFISHDGVLIAELDNEAVGFLEGFEYENKLLTEFELYVKPEFQGRKIGRALFDHFFDRLKNRHVETTMNELQHRSIRFFNERNFVEKQRRYDLEIDTSSDAVRIAETQINRIKPLGYEIFSFDDLFRIPGSEFKFSALVSERLNEALLSNKNLEPVLTDPNDIESDDLMTGDDKAFIVVKNGDFAGIAILSDVGESNCLWKFYGSSRDHAAHSEKINLALFGHACQYARSKGMNKIEISINAFDQQGMTLLRHFCKELPPAWITYMRPNQAV